MTDPTSSEASLNPAAIPTTPVLSPPPITQQSLNAAIDESLSSASQAMLQQPMQDDATAQLQARRRELDEQQKRHPYLHDLLMKTLCVSIKDGRMFVGEFECTDRDSNILLSRAVEYRAPSNAEFLAMAKAAAYAEEGTKVKLQMVSRYLGLVVVPGAVIEKIALEEAS